MNTKDLIATVAARHSITEETATNELLSAWRVRNDRSESLFDMAPTLPETLSKREAAALLTDLDAQAKELGREIVEAPKYTTREEWLVAAVQTLAPIYAEVGEELPATRVSVGWPGGSGRKNSVIGQCWASSASSDKVAQLFISPVLDDAVRVLDVLAHELIHAIDDCTSGHKGRFTKIAKGIGLTGKMTATVAGDELKARLDEVAAELGAYPHAAIAHGAGSETPKKQSTRMLKVECEEGSGYVVRMTRKWLDEYGTPSCPCHGEPMVEAL